LTQSASGNEKRGNKKILWASIVVVVVIIVVVAAATAVILSKPPTKKSNTVYFYTWWGPTSGRALQNLTEAFHTAYPQYTAVPTVSPGAGGTNAKYAILTLIKANDPPNTFQTHYGPEMLSYIEAAPSGANSFVNFTSYVQSNMANKAVSSVLAAGTYNGVTFSLPVDAHQGAQLFFNPQVLAKYSLPIPNNMSTLLSDTVALGSHGINAWVIPGGDGGWDQLNVWENAFLAYGGNTMYDELMYGTLNTSSPSVMHVLNETNAAFFTFEKYSMPGLESDSWLQALPYVLKGQAAFYTSGNWVLEYTTDYLNVLVYPATAPYTSWTNLTMLDQSFPGTQNYWVLVTDSVAVPSGPTSTLGLTFAKYFSSYAGDKVFTKTKAVTFYNNVTSDYYATQAQWYSYKTLLNTSPSNFVYQLSDGGLFDNVFASYTSAMTALSEIGPSDLAAWNLTLSSGISSEQSEWMTANSLGYGYMGFPGHPFGGYAPPWATAAVSGVAAHPNSVSTTGVTSAKSPTASSHIQKPVKINYVQISLTSVTLLQKFYVMGVSQGTRLL